MADLTSYEAPVHEAHALPVMLPPGKLVGRDVTLARVYAQLKDNKPVLVYGASGLGKTALGATLASAYTELPGGVLWFNVDDTPFPELLARIGRALNIRELETSDNPISLVAAAMSTLIAAKPMIVFDGRINAQAVSEFIMRCADRLPVLMLNETVLNGPWTAVPLLKLESPAATTMLKHLAPDQTNGIDDLMQVLDGSPFAIAVAAGAIRAKQQTPAEFLAALPKRQDVAPSLLALTASFGTLSSALQGVLLLMGATFRGEASAELFSLISGAPQEAITPALNTLVAQHLVERFTRGGSPYYRLHAITHTFAQTWLRGSGRLDGLQTKVRDAILAYARKYSGAPDRLAAEMENFLAAARWAADQGDRDFVNQLTVALMQAGDFVNAHGYVYELLLMRRLVASSTNAFPAHDAAQTPMPFAEAVPEAADAPPAADESAAEMSAAATEADLEDEDEDLIEDEDLVEDVDEDVDEALIDDDLADENEAPDEAVRPALDMIPPGDEDEDHFETTDFGMIDEPDDDQGESEEVAEDEDEDDEDDLDLLADVEDFEESQDLDEFEESEPISAPDLSDELARLRASLVQARQNANRRQQADLLSAIGQEQVRRGQETEAITTYSEALNVYETLNDQPGLLSTLEALAGLIVKTDTDNTQAAVMHAQRGVELAEELGSEASQIKLLMILGDAHQQAGESAEAERVYSEALDLARTTGDEANEALILYKLGYAQLDEGNPSQAMQTWEDALTRFREQSRRDYEGRTLAGLGTASGELDRWNEATRFYESALHIAREIKDRDEEMLRLNDLGYAAVQAHQLGQAVLRYRQALHLAFASSNPQNVVSTTVDLGRLLVESQRHLNITEMLVDAALALEPTDRDLKRLKERIQDEREVLPPDVKQAPVAGTAQDYAANAYSLLDN